MGDALRKPGSSKPMYCPYGHAGDRLWVREAWYAPKFCNDKKPRDLPQSTAICYAADNAFPFCFKGARLRPAMFMPRWTSRITLEVVAVRVERLRAITGKDILAEGAVDRPHVDQFGRNPVSAFDSKVYMDLISLWAAGWESINGKGSFAANPWVWVIEFKRI